MYLVDTSVWIDYFREKDNASVKKLEFILDKGHSFGITGAIYQEILQGANTEQDFTTLDTYLKTQRFYHPVNPLKTHQAAAQRILKVFQRYRSYPTRSHHRIMFFCYTTIYINDKIFYGHGGIRPLLYIISRASRELIT